MNCKACNNKVNRLESLKCKACDGDYHYMCLNITSAQYREHGNILKNNWYCPMCTNITRRKNDNTPVRKQFSEPLNDTVMSVDDLLNCTSDLSVLGNTEQSEIQMNLQTPEKPSVQETTQVHLPSAPHSSETITLDKISKLLDIKLRETVQDTIKNTIKTEIGIALSQFKHEILQSMSVITVQQNEIKNYLDENIKKIAVLEKKNNDLQIEMSELNNRLDNLLKVTRNDQNEDKNFKKIVLYGLKEYHRENQHYLYDRISNIFHDLLGINIDPYVEDLRWIGKYGSRRPLVIELLSKRVSNYILQNSHYFKNTGLTVSAYLDRSSLNERKRQREVMIRARQECNHAEIRKNELVINEKEVKLRTKSDVSATAETTLISHPNTVPRASTSHLSQDYEHGKTKDNLAPELNISRTFFRNK